MSGCLDERANAAVESFKAILQSAADGEHAARQDALRWRQDAVDLQRQVKELQQKYEQQVKRAEMFSKLVSNVSGKLDAAHTIDRGHITTITEADETSSPQHADVNLASAEMASAQTAQQAPAAAGTASTQPAQQALADGPVLPKVRVSSQMEPNKGSLPASRQNSLPDLGLPRMTRKRSSNLRPGARAGPRGSLMESASSGSLKRQGSPVRTTVGSLASWLMAYTMMQDNPKQRAAAQQINGWSDNPENVDISAVSVLDDDGASGVGAAAAAAVSVALARSWASAASQKQIQAAMVERTTSGSLKPGRAGFRLVAAVSNTDLARLAKDATPKGGSTPHKLPSTPPFTSPREQTIHHQHSTSLNSQQSGSVLSGSTPFASLSGCPFPDGDMSSVCTTIMEQISEKGPRGGSRQGGLGVGTEGAPLSQSVGSERAPFSQGDTPSSMPSSASFQTAGSLPILAESSQIMHRRAEFAAGTGTLPPAGNGVAPTRISPMLHQTQILKDTRHRRDAYARGVGDIPPPPPKVVLEPTLSSDSADSLAGQDGSAQLPNGRGLTDPAAAGPSDPAEPVPQRQQLPPTQSIEAACTRSAALPPGRTGLPHTESFNTDVVQENLESHRNRRQQQQQEGGRGLSHTGSHLQLHWLSRPRTVLVVAKPSPEVLLSLVNVVFWLLQRDTTVYVEPSIFHRMTESIKVRTAAGLKSGNLVTWLPEPETGEIPRPVADRLDWVITLGGDGTVLWTCSILGNGPVPPLVPFAMGSLGFMTPFAMDRMQKVLTKIMDGGFSLMLRHRLHCKIERADNTNYLGDGYVPVADVNTELDEQVVLNEVVIDRGVSPFLCNLECYCDGNFVTHVQGDGLIVATPTGSTAYNLAAGGSMVHPQVPGVLFTPINPHSLSSRPLILPESIQIRVRVPQDSRSEMWCSFDGKDRQRLAPGDSVLIFMSQHPIPTVCKLDASHDWFLSMSDGLHWNLRKRQAGAGK